MVKLVPAISALATLSAFTEFAFNASPVQFVMGKKYGDPTQGYGNYLPGNSLSLMELFNIGQLEGNAVPAIDQIKNNMQRDGALTKYIMTQVGITVLTKLVRKAGTVRAFNKLSRAVGTESIVMG